MVVEGYLNTKEKQSTILGIICKRNRKKRRKLFGSFMHEEQINSSSKTKRRGPPLGENPYLYRSLWWNKIQLFIKNFSFFIRIKNNILQWINLIHHKLLFIVMLRFSVHGLGCVDDHENNFLQSLIQPNLIFNLNFQSNLSMFLFKLD